MVRQQNSFSRTAANDMKMGYYPTDDEHCMSLGETLVFSEESKTACLEPCCGEGNAIMALTRPDTNTNIRWFCVELNEDRAKISKENPAFEEVVCDDFLEGMRMKKNAFSFCFCNPPYQTDDLNEAGAERVEKQFLVKINDYLTKDALMLWVVPYNSFVDISQFRFMVQRFDILKVWKFRPDEYRKFHQVCVVLRKKSNPRIILKEELDSMKSEYSSIEMIEELPMHPTERFDVYPSDADKVIPFCRRRFDEYAAMNHIMALQNTSEFDDLNKLLNKRTTQKTYSFGKAGRPPIPPKKDTLYLMATSGYGAGLTGSTVNHDLHLQRGVAEVIEETVYEPNPSNPNKDIARVTSRTQVTMTVVQNDGTITVLE